MWPFVPRLEVAGPETDTWDVAARINNPTRWLWGFVEQRRKHALQNAHNLATAPFGWFDDVVRGHIVTR